MRSVVFLCVLITFASAAVPADEITSLPGWDGPLPTRQYSGYLSISGGKHLHYWLVQSETNPSTAPTVFWFNGGPGCSSLGGFFYEQGPFHVIEPFPTVGVPLLYRNPYAWNKIANMVFLEAPACVGMSYADSTAGCRNSDTQQAVDNLAAVQQFYILYPEYLNNDLYLTGESYAGMYVPTLALQILSYNNQTSGTKIPLKGIAVGNGVIGQNTGEPAEQQKVDFLFGHGLFSNATYQKILKDCGDFSKIGLACSNDLAEMSIEVGGVNIYDIYDVCINDNAKAKKQDVWFRPPTEVDLLGGPVACIDGAAAEAYLNQDAVRTAIHVKSVAQIGKWAVCGGNLSYTQNWGSLLPNYKNTLIPAIRVLIYNGDVDCCVPYNGNEWWTSNLGIPQTKGWTSWSVDGQVAGYITNYQHSFQFVTVKGAGHMVPQYKPAEALAMLQRFIAGTCC